MMMDKYNPMGLKGDSLVEVTKNTFPGVLLIWKALSISREFIDDFQWKFYQKNDNVPEGFHVNIQISSWKATLERISDSIKHLWSKNNIEHLYMIQLQVSLFFLDAESWHIISYVKP